MEYSSFLLKIKYEDNNLYMFSLFYPHYTNKKYIVLNNVSLNFKIQRHYLYHNSDLNIKKQILESFDFYVLQVFIDKILKSNNYLS